MDTGNLTSSDNNSKERSLNQDDMDSTENDLLTAAAESERQYKEERPEQADESASSEEEEEKEEDEECTKASQSKEEDSDEYKEQEASSEEEEETQNRQEDSDSEPGITLKRKGRKMSEEAIKLLEVADVLRRSRRSRKEVQRLEVGAAESDEDDKPKRRGRRIRMRKSFTGSDSKSGSSASSSSDFSRPKRKTTRKKTRKKAANKRKRGADSSDDDWSDDSTNRRTTTRGASSRVDYKEASSEEEVNSEDVLEWEEDVVPSTSQPEIPCETIEKVLKTRIGRPGALGSATTCYNVEDKGDPNSPPPAEGEGERQFLIKWVGWAYIHNTWESEESLKSAGVKGLKKLDNYMNRLKQIEEWKETADKESIEYFDCEQEMSEELYDQYKQAERIIATSKQRDKERGSESTDYFVKWVGLPYADSTWEDGALISRWFQSKIDQYEDRVRSKRIPHKHCHALKKRPKFVQYKEQPEFLGGNNKGLLLRDYQLDGVNWLLQAWCRKNSVILADEMGLGKTIQTISFLSVLHQEHEVYGPFLVVVPLSTMAAWQREFEQWAPELNVIVYLGDMASRNLIRQYEWQALPQKRLKFNVCLTTYEILLKDKAFLGSFDWSVLMVDEAHRLKNDESLLYQALIHFKTNHRLLITGTPLQNSLKELWALLHFIMDDKFESWESFEEIHGGSDNKYSSLHKELEPFLLRRVKKDVEKSLPAKVEQILRVDMTAIQKQYYKWILTKNYRALSKGVKGSITGFLNLMMELKKCCNHSCLVRQPDNESSDPQERLQQIIKSSGKLILLDKLLLRLEQTGHRVLIFSQMVMLLDILQEYLRLRKFAYQRLDGSMRGDLRRQALDHFNSEGSTDFCFLLSTKAGGLGINLATADTVIIFDSDWNPQNDLQAQSRAHRIGQTKQVNIYRLVTKGSVEEDIVERAKRKLVLDHLVIQRMDTTGKTILSKNAVSSSGSVPFDKEELAAILKFGAEDLFKENEGEEQEPEVDIDEILQRAETREMESTSAVGDELLGAFKYATFTIDEEEEIEMKPKSEANKDWEDIIPDDHRKKIEEEERLQMEQELHLPPRQRNNIQHMARNEDSDDDWEKKRKKRKKENSSDSSDSSDDDKPQRKRAKKALYGFTESEIRKFVKSFRKFAQPMSRLEAIACDAELEEHSTAELRQLGEDLIKGCKQAYEDHENQPKPQNEAEAKKTKKGPLCKVGPVEVLVRPLLKTQADLEPLYQCMPETPHERKHFYLSTKPKPVKNWDVDWDDGDDAALLRGIYEFGLGSWESIKMDPELGLNEKIILSDKNKKPQTKQVQARAEYLLKFLQTSQEQSGQIVRPKRDLDALISSVILASERPRKELKAPRKEKGTPVNAKLKEKPKKPNKPRKSEIEEGELESERKVVIAAKKEPKVRKPTMTIKTDHLDVQSRYSADLEDASSDLFKECVTMMRKASKHIRQLVTEKSEEEKSQHLIKIGDHIQDCLVSKAKNEKLLQQWLSYLWIFVSKFTQSSASKWRNEYRKVCSNRSLLSQPRPEEQHHDKKHHHHHHHDSKEHKHRHHENKEKPSDSHPQKQHHHHKHQNQQHHSSHPQHRGAASTSNESQHNRDPRKQHNESWRNSSYSKPDAGQQKRDDIGRGNYRNSPVGNSKTPWHHSRYEEPRYNMHRVEKSYNDMPNPYYQRNSNNQQDHNNSRNYENRPESGNNYGEGRRSGNSYYRAPER